ncbi:transglycosylase domain-containing protein [Phenylobacterium sp.]|uniref:transglycosylase domain-containing protein n=1 Tax=Phenylobacterium sp. TaxID=1871053 RepID=UPI00121DB295|nr:PBP1A family penicillin-binding protein [Phenylobacterium sp.]THD64769.1 MAG: PBP1A family penicillin-binding protein [Phenylobacterium sp.]
MIALFAAAAMALPPTDFSSRLPPITREAQITYVDRSGAVIGVRGGKFAPPVDLTRVPSYVPAAFVSIEDRRFYEHSGFDPVGMARAMIADLEKGKAREGASTITQQLARNLYLSADQTIERKADELVIAVKLEQTYSKKQILALYLSRVYFGSGAYGLEAASQRYFNKPAAKLTVREAAMLAGILKSPTAYDPADNPEKSAERTKLVLDAMVETGAISEAERDKAMAQTPKVWKQAPNAPAQYFVDWLDGQTRATIGNPRQDIVVETTLDLPAEIAASDAAKAATAKFAKQGVSQAAVVSLDGSGRVRAMVGGVDYAKGPFNRAIDAHRQAGSAWKPFVYTAAMESGRTPDLMVVDEPVTINGWSPHNVEPTFMGQITLETALAHSVNTVAARLADEVGRDNVAAVAHRMGIVSPINTDPAMALGTSLVTPFEMAQAYDTFGNGGYRISAYGIERIRTASGQVLFQHKPQLAALAVANPPLDEMQRMMRTVMISGTGTHANVPGYDLAGKTGTTSDYKDAWFCGYTGGITTVVWTGRDDAKPMLRIMGASAPSEIWHAYMAAALKRLPNGPIPPGPPPPLPVVPTPVETPPAPEPVPQATPTAPAA